MALAIPHEPLSDHVKNRKAVLYDRGKLLFKTLCDYIRHGIAVHCLCACPALFLKFLLSAFHVRRVRALRDRTDTLYHIVYEIGVLNYDLVRLFLAEIREFHKHLLGGSEIKVYISVVVLEFHACKEYLAAYLVLFVKEVSVAGSNYRLVVFLTERYYLSVELAQVFVIRYSSLCDKESVVAYRLYLKIIVEGHDLLDLLLGLVFKHGSEKLACLTS